MADKTEKPRSAAKPAPESPDELSPKDPAIDRLCNTPMPIGELEPFDPELYEPPLTQEELDELRDEDDDDD